MAKRFLCSLGVSRRLAIGVIGLMTGFVVFGCGLLVSEAQAIRILAGTGQWGNQFVAGGDPKQTQLNFPGGVCVLPDGRVLIADSGNHRVLVVSVDGETINLYAGTGQWGNQFVAGGDPKQTQLINPRGVCVLPDGRVLITDTQNSRMLVVSADGKTINLYAGTGQQGSQFVQG